MPQNLKTIEVTEKTLTFIEKESKELSYSDYEELLVRLSAAITTRLKMMEEEEELYQNGNLN